MASANPTNYDTTGKVFRSQSFAKFLERMKEIEQVVSARTAMATVEYVNESLVKSKEMSPKDFVNGIINYSHSRPIRRLGYHAINEATMVLLSACLEGFIENLHEEAMGELLDERIESRGVLKSLIGYAHRGFGNPWPRSIKGLFKTCGMMDIISNLERTDRKEIDQLVKIRNKIAHGGHMPDDGRDVEDWVRLIHGFADDLNSAVEREINATR